METTIAQIPTVQVGDSAKAGCPSDGAETRVTDFSWSVTQQVRNYTQRLGHTLQDNILGPMEKGMEAARMQTPPKHVVDGVDLRVLPKFLCYKAALLRERTTLQALLWLLAGAFVIFFVHDRWEISRLMDRLRTKEYILAPGVQDFTPVSPQSVPDSHVENAATAFLGALGNINASNIDEQYKFLTDSMSPELKMRFQIEAEPWIAKVKHDNITETLKPIDRHIENNHDGYYKVVLFARKESFADLERLGETNVVIEMILKLMPPVAGKQWYLEIESLESHGADAFRAKSDMIQTQQQGGGK